MEFSIFESQLKSEKYDNQKVINKIKIIRLLTKKRRNSKKVEKLKLQIFLMMKNIIIKNINNYIKYSSNSSVADYAHNSLEMESEAFLILDNCIKLFKYKYDFYFYYNKGLSRTFYRMFDKDKRMRDKDFIYKGNLFHKNKTSFALCNFEIDIFNLGLDSDETLVLKSKMIDETKEMFLKNNPSFAMSKYYVCIKKIKNLLISLKENDEL